jgi:hypothetical protein
MQLAPIASAAANAAVHPPITDARPAAPAPSSGAGLAAAPVAPAAASAPLAGAVDGVLRLIDFPGIAAGDAFDIVKGSKVGFLGVKGDADILRFDDDAASFHVRAGAFGVKVDVTVEVEQTGPDTVRISSRGTGIPDQSADGRIVASRTNYAEFVRTDDPTQRTVISRDAATGRITIDTAVPGFGNAHLLLDERR